MEEYFLCSDLMTPTQNEIMDDSKEFSYDYFKDDQISFIANIDNENEYQFVQNDVKLAEFESEKEYKNVNEDNVVLDSENTKEYHRVLKKDLFLNFENTNKNQFIQEKLELPNINYSTEEFPEFQYQLNYNYNYRDWSLEKEAEYCQLHDVNAIELKVATKPIIAPEKIINSNEKIGRKYFGCNCKTTKCLKRYCPCFSNGGYCGPNCGCYECTNTIEFKEIIGAIKQKTQEIYQHSFKQKIVKTRSGNLINPEGCKCESGCISKLCGCSQNSVGCSPICKCVSCKNKFVSIESDEVKLLYRQPIRKRERISFRILPETSNPKNTRDRPFVLKKGITNVFFLQKANSEASHCAEYDLLSERPTLSDAHNTRITQKK